MYKGKISDGDNWALLILSSLKRMFIWMYTSNMKVIKRIELIDASLKK